MVQVDPEFTMEPRPASDSRQSCLSLPGARMKMNILYFILLETEPRTLPMLALLPGGPPAPDLLFSFPKGVMCSACPLESTTQVL